MRVENKMTVTAVLTKRCNRSCWYCIGECAKKKWSDTPDLDFCLLLHWLNTYYPKCDLHLSGGEPLLVEDIRLKVEAAVAAGHRVSVFTNGDLLPGNEDLPVAWHVTHHLPMSTEEFLANIQGIKNKPHIITRIRWDKEALNNTEAEAAKYQGFNFHWSIPFSGRDVILPLQEVDRRAVASKAIHMIEVDGNVYPCSTKRRSGPIGNVYEGTYDPGDLREIDEQADVCVNTGKCSAYQSAVLMGQLTGR